MEAIKGLFCSLPSCPHESALFAVVRKGSPKQAQAPGPVHPSTLALTIPIHSAPAPDSHLWIFIQFPYKTML